MLDYIEKFEGIIGAILGVIVTLIVTHTLKNSGKTKIYLVKQNVKIGKREISEIGDTRHVDAEKSSAEYCDFDAVLEIYNGSEVFKIFRDIKICFYRKNSLLFSIIPDDKTTAVRGQHWINYDEALSTNVPAKQITILELRKFIDFERDIDKLKNSDSIYIEMKNHKNKRFRLKIISI